jgi:hypothetical protein
MLTSSANSINGDTEFYNLMINKSSGSCTNNNNLLIRNMLRLNSGLFNTGDMVTMILDVDGTARVDRINNGSISEDIIAQRYFPTTTDDWHLLASPVQNRTLLDWDDDLLTMGFPGSDYLSFYFNNTTYYDESFPGDKDEGLLNFNL